MKVIRHALVLALLLATVGAATAQAAGTRNAIYLTTGFCEFDTFLNRGGTLGTTATYGVAQRCIGVPATVIRDMTAHLYSADQNLQNGAHEHSFVAQRSFYDHAESRTYTNALNFQGVRSYFTQNDAYFELFPPGSQKNPSGVRFTGSDTGRCSVRPGGLQVVCSGIGTFVK